MSVRTLVFAAAVAGTAHLLGPAFLSARQAPATVSAPKVFAVVARKFEFVPARLEVTEGDHVRLFVKSEDGVHGVGIKKFKVSKVIPRGGEPVTIDFVASAPGSVAILAPSIAAKGTRR